MSHDRSEKGWRRDEDITASSRVLCHSSHVTHADFVLHGLACTNKLRYATLLILVRSRLHAWSIVSWQPGCVRVLKGVDSSHASDIQPPDHTYRDHTLWHLVYLDDSINSKYPLITYFIIMTRQCIESNIKKIQIYRLECMANHCDPSYSEKGSAAPKIDQFLSISTDDSQGRGNLTSSRMMTGFSPKMLYSECDVCVVLPKKFVKKKKRNLAKFLKLFIINFFIRLIISRLSHFRISANHPTTQPAKWDKPDKKTH